MTDQEQIKANYTKPSVISRLTSGLTDLLLTVGVIVGLYLIVLKTPLADNMKAYSSKMNEIQERYLVDESAETKEYIKFSEWSEKDQTDYKDYRFYYTLNQGAYLMGSAAISELVFYFVIPLTNKRRASVGMLLAGEDLMAMKYYGSPKWYHLLGRYSVIFFLGTLLPYLAISEMTVFVVPALVMTFALINSKTNRTIHDLLTGTIIVMNEKTLAKLQERARIRQIAREEKQQHTY